MVTTFLLLTYFTHGYSGEGAEVAAREFPTRQACEIQRQTFVRTRSETNAGGVCVPVKRGRPRVG